MENFRQFSEFFAKFCMLDSFYNKKICNFAAKSTQKLDFERKN